MSCRSNSSRPPQGLVLGASALLLLLPFWSSAQSRLIRINPSDPNLDTKCQELQNGTWGSRSLATALKDPLCVREGDRILFECDAPDPSTGTCDVDLKFENAEAILQNGITLESRPARALKLLVNQTINAPVVKIQGHQITFDGVVVDGLNRQAYAVLLIEGNNFTFKNSIATGGRNRAVDGDGTIISIAGADGTTIESSEVSNCGGDRHRDCHCINTQNGTHIEIRANRIHHCTGDGIQLENRFAEPVESQTCPFPRGDWKSVRIVANEIWTSDGPSGYRPGENGIDIKSGLGDLHIIGNTIHGFRSFDAISSASGGSGTGSKGDGIVIHGQLDLCGNSPSNPYCVEVRGNDIYDTNVGISIAQNPNLGAPPSRILIERNTIHDLASDGSYEDESLLKGVGIRLGTAKNILVANNTLANIPGLGLVEPGPDLDDQACLGEDRRCESCEFSNNLLVHAGEHCDVATTRVFDQNGGSYRGNICIFSGKPGTRKECESGTWGNNRHFPFDDPNINGADFQASWQPPAGCGNQTDPLPADLSFTFDYKPGPGSSLIDYALAGPSMTGYRCGSEYERGARESCDTSTTALPPVNVDGTTGRLIAKSPDFFQLSTQFASGIGAYGNAVRFTTDTSPPAPLVPNSPCGDEDGNAGCVYFTSRCLSECTPQPYLNGEINCSCIKPQELFLGTFESTSVSGRHFPTDLNSDTNQDRKFDLGTLGGNAPVSDFGAMQYTPLTQFSGVMGWEDRTGSHSKSDGDRDDFIHSVVGFSCTTEGSQQLLSSTIPPSESFGCPSGNSCSTCTPLAEFDDLRFDAQVSIDGLEEGGLEGRQLHLTVTVYNFNTELDRPLAICPTLHLNKHASDGATIKAANFPGDQGCTGTPSLGPGSPDCTFSAPLPGMSIAFARFQDWSAMGCHTGSGTPGGDDAIRVAPASRCGSTIRPSHSTLQFEVPLVQLDGLYAGGLLPGIANLKPSKSSLQQLAANYLGALSITSVSNLSSRSFYCPSGFGLRTGEIDPSIGSVRRITISTPRTVTR